MSHVNLEEGRKPSGLGLKTPMIPRYKLRTKVNLGTRSLDMSMDLGLGLIDEIQLAMDLIRTTQCDVWERRHYNMFSPCLNTYVVKFVGIQMHDRRKGQDSMLGSVKTISLPPSVF